MKRYLTQMAQMAAPAYGLLSPLALLPLAALGADTRPDTLAAAGGNPLALSAMAFLGWYWKSFFVLALVAVIVRFLRKVSGTEHAGVARLGDDPYLMAYLAGGPQQVVGAVLASLVSQGALRVNAVTRELISEEEISKDRPKIEHDVRDLLRGARQVSDKARFQRWIQGKLRSPLTLMHRHLQRAGLLGRPLAQVWALLPLRIGFGLLLVIGVLRLVAGIAAGRPVGFLVISMIVTGFAAYWLLRGMGKERATQAGERLLKECRSRLGRGGDDRLWMASLLGLAGLGIGPMADLEHVVQEIPKGEGLGGLGSRKSGSGGSSGNGGCGDGGCGGGGCGGCGG